MIIIYLTNHTGDDPRKRHITEHRIGRQMLSIGLNELYGLSFTEDALNAELSSGQHGKPFLAGYPDIHFNISHCQDLIACVFSDSPVGIDAENIRSFPSNVLRKVLTVQEQQTLKSAPSSALQEELFFRFWTLKESRIKQSGTGMAAALTDFSFEPVTSSAYSSPDSSIKDLKFHQWKLDSGHILSLCTSDIKDIPVLRSLQSDTFSL